MHANGYGLQSLKPGGRPHVQVLCCCTGAATVFRSTGSNKNYGVNAMNGTRFLIHAQFPASCAPLPRSLLEKYSEVSTLPVNLLIATLVPSCYKLSGFLRHQSLTDLPVHPPTFQCFSVPRSLTLERNNKANDNPSAIHLDLSLSDSVVKTHLPWNSITASNSKNLYPSIIQRYSSFLISENNH
ncbi:hypothetical protein CRENBAI_003699 [Crenichthys baileyi]|uniref:Uncharacterized protein n=1 Tax=Crenichthys baileyi TaxID=28760 RepID=A0AAV9SM86_9TELE